MTRNMGVLDRGLRASIGAPVAIVVAFILGATTLVGIILFVMAGIMLVTAARGIARRTRSSASRPTTECTTWVAITCAAGTPSRLTKAF